MQSKPTSQYLSHFLIAIGTMILCMLVFSMLAMLLSERLFGIDPKDILNLENQVELNSKNVNAARLYMGVASIGSFIVSSIIVIITFRKSFLGFTGLNRPPRIVNIVLGILLLLASIPLINWFLELNQNIPIPSASLREFLHHQEELNNFTYDVILTGNTGMMVVVNLFLMALLPAVGEELFFRGIMVRVFKSLTNNMHLGVWLSAMLFATLHVQVLKIVPMILIGALFGYVYYLSGSLWVPIAMHFVNNSIAVIADHLAEPHTGTSQLAIEELSSAWYMITLSVFLLTSLFIYLKKSNPNPPDLQIE